MKRLSMPSLLRRLTLSKVIGREYKKEAMLIKKEKQKT